MPRPDLRTFGLAVLLVASCQHTDASATRQLGVKIIYAHGGDAEVDPRLRSLIKQLTGLKFTSFLLRDEATFNLEPGSAGRMQLPNQTWVSLTLQGLAEDGRVRLAIEMDDLQLKSIVALSPGATVAVGGPPFAQGALILAVTLL